MKKRTPDSLLRKSGVLKWVRSLNGKYRAQHQRHVQVQDQIQLAIRE
jgi:hypothetical protein